MDVVGIVKKIGETGVYGQSGFKKRELILTTDEQYPQDLSIEFVQAKCEELDRVSVGEKVRIHINLRGREWINEEGEAKYFNSIQGWKINTSSGDEPATNTSPPVAPEDLNDEVDPLPF